MKEYKFSDADHNQNSIELELPMDIWQESLPSSLPIMLIWILYPTVMVKR